MHLPRFTVRQLMLAVAFAAALLAVAAKVRERNRWLSMTLTEKLHWARGTHRPIHKIPGAKASDGR